MRTHRFRLIVLAALVGLVALRATRSRPAAPAPRRSCKSSGAPPIPDLRREVVGGSPPRPSRFWRPQVSGRLTAHRFELIALAALVLFVGSSAVGEPMHSVAPAIVTPPPPLSALTDTPEAFSKPARNSARGEQVKLPPRPHSVTPSVIKPSQKPAAVRPVHQMFSKPARDSAQLEHVEPKRPLHSVTPFVVKPSQKLAALLSTHEVFSEPAGKSARLGLIRARRPLTRARTVLPVVGARIGARGIGWLRVGLPGRPNGRTGWIKRRATVASTTRWHIVVDTSRRRVTVYRNSRPMRIVEAIVGKPSTPTPRGTFFVEEAIQLRPTDTGAPYALALSARSNVLQEFDGGPGQTALHGLANVGGILGSAVSHGCVRLDNDTMRWLVHRIGSGVPVTVRG